MGLRKSLGIHVPWPELAPLLGIPLTTQALPVQVVCPLCEGQLHLYEDNIKGGAWHYCSQCRSQGDLLELAARCFGMDIEPALQKLADAGIAVPVEALTDTRIHRHVHDHHERRDDITSFWETAREHLLRQQRAAGLNALRARLRLVWRGDPERWRKGPGVLLGSVSCKHVKEFFASQPAALGKWRSTGDALMMPYYDLPGRIAGLFFVGGAGERTDMLWHRPPRVSGSTDEFGLAGLPIVTSPASKGPIVAVNDPLLMARIQVRQAHITSKLLPLVAWHDGSGGTTRDPWKVLAGRRLIFWNWTLTAALVKQAVATGGELSLAGPEIVNKKRVELYLSQRLPEELYRSVVRQAWPWQELLSQQIIAGKDGWCEGLFIALQREGADVASIVNELRPKARQLISDLLKLPAAERVVQVAGNRISERNGRWYYSRKGIKKVQPAEERLAANSTGVATSDGTEQLLSNFLVRIEEVRVTGNGKPHYQGKLYFGLTVVPFNVPQRQLELHTLIKLRELAYSAKVPGTLYVRGAYWAKQLIPIALAFYTPVITE